MLLILMALALLYSRMFKAHQSGIYKTQSIKQVFETCCLKLFVCCRAQGPQDPKPNNER